jgi:hypothetical protein
LISLYRLFSNLIRFSPSISVFRVVSRSVTQSVMADVDIRRNLFDTTIVASEPFDHVHFDKSIIIKSKKTFCILKLYRKTERKKHLYV